MDFNAQDFKTLCVENARELRSIVEAMDEVASGARIPIEGLAYEMLDDLEDMLTSFRLAI